MLSLFLEGSLTPGKDYKLDLHRNGRCDVEGPKRTLFAFVDPKVFERPLVKHFIALLDNYERRVRSNSALDRNYTVFSDWRA